MVGHKRVMCIVYYREMKSDVLKRHMKQHSKTNESVLATNILETSMYKCKFSDLSSEDPEQICKSILEDVINDIHNKEKTSMYRKKPKLNYLNTDGLDETHKPLTVGVDTMQFENILLYDNHEYKRKLDLGKDIYEFKGTKT